MFPWAAVSLALPVWFHDIDTGRGAEQLSCRGSLSLGVSAVFPEIRTWGQHAWQGPRKQWCAVHHGSRYSRRSAPRLVVLTLTLWVGRLHGFPTAELPCSPFVFNKLHVGRVSEIPYHSQFYQLTFSIHE